MKSDVEILMDSLVTLTVKQMDMMKAYPVEVYKIQLGKFIETMSKQLLIAYKVMEKV